MVTDRDITVRGVAASMNPNEMTVRDVLSEGVCYVYDDDDAEACASAFAEHQVRRMPVLNRDKRMVGIVSLADLAKAGIKDAEFRAYESVAEPTGESRHL
jgi:CBS-domain-containing membrane protein